MAMPDKKDHNEQKENRTGEDIDMLHEREQENKDDSDSSSYAYRDNYDAA